MEKSELLLTRRVETQEVIRGKYHLPSRQMRILDPWEYVRTLEKMAIGLGVDIRMSWEYSSYPNAQGAHYSRASKSIFLPSKNDIRDRAAGFEHELIHAMQHTFYPRMSLRMREYEAYLVAYNLRKLSEPRVIGFFIRLSVAGI